MIKSTCIEHIKETHDSSDQNNIVFGECLRCGGEPEDGFPPLGGADADRYSDQNQKLVLYQGEFMCPRCMENLILDEESLIKMDKIRDEKIFLSRLGFTDTIT